MFNSDKIFLEIVGKVSGNITHYLHSLFIAGAEIQPNATDESWQIAIYEQSPLKERIEYICRAANGESIEAHLLNEKIQAVCETLFISPFGHYEIPKSFWKTELGQAIQQAQLNASGDSLITISDAAVILFDENSQNNRMKIQRMLTRGELTAYLDSGEPNPQRQTRLSYNQVLDAKEF